MTKGTVEENEHTSAELMSWRQLMCKTRLKEMKPQRAARSSFVVDQDIIINSQPFRRLQDKTQVHPISQNDHVRRRLTHSLEVASIGRALGVQAAKGLLKAEPALKAESVSTHSFGEVLFAACLAHDIGNPPFGHYGEDAIKAAFARLIENRTLDLKKELTRTQQVDLTSWEGNAHGFRVLNTLEGRPPGGMGLTVATLATFAKYPWGSDSPLAGEKKKFGYFATEKDAFASVAREVGLLPREGGWCRHPLAHLVEAADDIAYAIGDLEDGVELKLIHCEEVIKIFRRFVRHTEIDDPQVSVRKRLEFLREDVVSGCVNSVARLFVEKRMELLAGALPKGLIELSDAWQCVKKAKDLAFERVFQAQEKAYIEVAAFDVLGALVETLAYALLGKDPNGSRRGRRVLELMGQRDTSRVASLPKAECLMIAADYVGGMTDSFALKQFRNIKGIDFSAPR